MAAINILISGEVQFLQYFLRELLREVYNCVTNRCFFKKYFIYIFILF